MVDEDRCFSRVPEPTGVLGGRDGQANLMVVFFGGPSILIPLGAGLGGGAIDVFSSRFGLAAQANEMRRLFSSAAGAASGAKPTLGSRGLGELVRAGVVKPVLQVRAAVEAKLVLLVMDRLR
jgi:hypothetical protein